MPPQAGEATLLTLYADILYTFSPPEHKPPHQRFDKASIIYLYQKSPEGHGRLELANNAGTAEQDAVAGSLENVQIKSSYKKSTTLTIRPSQAQPWKLPTFDPRQERKYMYPIQSIDIYFWEPQEALLCLESLRRTHRLDHFSIEDIPDGQREHDDAMSPVIDRLERAAIDAQHQRRKGSSSPEPSAHPDSASLNSYRSTPITASGDSSAAFAPMPYNPAAPAAPEARVHREKTPPPPETEVAPGAADPHAYGSPQNLYGHHYQANQFAPPPPQVASSYALPSPPPQQQASPPPQSAQHGSSYLPPPPPTQPSVSPPPASAYQSAVQTPLPFSPPPTQPSFNQQSMFQQQHASGPSIAGAYGQQQPHPQQYFPPQVSQTPGYPHQPQSPGFAPAPQSPGFAPPPQSPGFAPPPPQSPGFAPPIPQGKPTQPGQTHPYQHHHHHHQQQQQQQQQSYPQSYSPASVPQHPQSAHTQHTQQPTQQPPMGGYSTYSYTQQPAQHQQNYDPNAIHSQVYRPTEAEAAHTKPQGQQGTGTWGSRADKAEKSVNRFLKKLDKKW